jgi:hypothetical protein
MARYAKFFSVGGGGGGTNSLQLPLGTILDTTLRTVQDGLGTNSVLQLSTYRVGIKSDSTVTTQTSSVIQSSTTNANLVIAPNGTGALLANIPDGTATGGNARGNFAVDFQQSRTASNQVSSGFGSTIIGGLNNRSSGNYSTTSGNTNIASGVESTAFGAFNTASGNTSFAVGNGATASGPSSFAQGTSTASAIHAVSLGSSNTASSSYSTVSGGQSNTASTGAHATVVGGQSNTASAQYSVAGGISNTASSYGSTSFGSSNNASGNRAFVAGGDGNTASGNRNIVLAGQSNQAISDYSVASGQYAITYLAQQRSIGNRYDNLGSPSDSQISDLIACKLATLNTASTTVLSLDGTGISNLLIPRGNNRLWAAKITATAFVSVAGGTLVLGDSYMGEYTLLFKKVGGVSSVVGVTSGTIIYDTNMLSATFTFAAGASQDLQITFKAPTTASATTFRCVARVELTEVAY